MNIYYETEHRNPGDVFPCITSHDTLTDAIQFAEANNLPNIYTIGGDFATLEKCPVCGEWVDICDLSPDGFCPDCERLGREHGF